MRAWPVVILVSILALGCPRLTEAELPALTSFQVEVSGVYTTARAPLDVVNPCAVRYGGQAQVPTELRGTQACRYVIPRGEILLDVAAVALDSAGQPLPSFTSSVSFKVIPGDVAGSAATRWAVADAGVVTATVHAVHQYGEVRVWVQDSPPEPLYTLGEVLDAGPPPQSAEHTFAAGASAVLYFDNQSLQSLQVPPEADNRSSPFVGDFVAVGKNPESGEVLTQSCTSDPGRDGVPAMMVVTGLDPAGFYVTDLSACRLVDPTTDTHQAPEPLEACLATLEDGGVTQLEVTDGGPGACAVSRKSCHLRSDCGRYLPGTYASMFVYNYNYPDGLFEGDLLFTLSGSVQEFTSTTQMVFPAWSVAEHVRTLPVSQWDKWLKFVPRPVVDMRACGMDDVAEPFVTDQLCGHTRRNLKLESLESALVRLRNVRFPTELDNCDFNGDATVPFFCEQTDSAGVYFWGSCAFGEVEPDIDRRERECYQACTLGTGVHAGKVCTEGATYTGFGQYVVELGMPGLASAGLDDSIPERFQLAAVPAPPADGGTASPVAVTGYSAGNELAIACTGEVHYQAGSNAGAVDASSPVLAANTALPITLGPGQSGVALLSAGGAASCSVGLNVRGRINLITKDAVPELSVDCRVDDADPAEATRCRALRGATFDVVGHLRQIQPARPRWAVVPRYPEDLCCHPAPGLECPKPIKTCQ